ncbi:toll/interleukin-1 receptor domain-containing protein [Algibacter lectus]|uniref:TIR domain-containing protein n=1 Tax=Algibacter lectus TaxID=221126 RepID=A0A4R8MIX0_9FLAO|nr:toll/interleukin-1 receptor domain-containing protein [Algibacter lectus]MWW25020.1 TIR domain-containing protein [Algibacter lectus]TDY64567.1 TIR domain-containing protein [Algibacter lectus]
MDKIKIFISHSSKDILLVESFVKHILRLGLDIPASRIFCTSMEGHGIRSGEYIPDRLKTEIQLASLALLFISDNYKKSEICLNEVGAAWASLEKTNVIPILLPEINFNQLGFLDLNRLGLKIGDKKDILKFINDNKTELNPTFNLELVHEHIEEFLKETQNKEPTEEKKEEEIPLEVNEWNECFEKNLIPFDHIIRKSIPAHDDGIHEIKDVQTQTKLMKELGRADFLRKFWYKKSAGDFYVERIRQLPTGNWLISAFNWEIKISTMWVSKNTEPQNEFFLIHSELLPPFKIESDIGGESHNVGILTDGTIVSENERLNGYAIINGETVDLHEHGVEPRIRDRESHWVFLISDYHKAGFNPDETIKFCEKIDKGEIEVSKENLRTFIRSLRNHPTVLRWR